MNKYTIKEILHKEVIKEDNENDPIVPYISSMTSIYFDGERWRIGTNDLGDENSTSSREVKEG